MLSDLEMTFPDFKVFVTTWVKWNDFIFGIYKFLSDIAEMEIESCYENKE
jgi:hypothetical protein